VFGQVDETLGESMNDALADGRHDFLHEGLGIALYFLEKLPDPAARAQLERALSRLEATANGDERALRWQDRFTRRGREALGPCYNLGLAHGTPAIVSILAMYLQHGLATSRVETLLRGATRWLRSARNPPDSSSLYPIMVDADNQALGPVQSRLGWCYGDLAVAVALLNAGTALRDHTCVDEACAVLEHTLTHRTAENGAIEDASLCHGSMGVSHIYRRAYLATDDVVFRHGADRWLARTLELGAGSEGAAGFRFRERDAYVDRFDLLQGITGIGLGLLAALDRAVPRWDRCLLLS
jgi:lantibiotic modifying enzyme